MKWDERIKKDDRLRDELARLLDLYAEYRDVEDQLSNAIEETHEQIKGEEGGDEPHPMAGEFKGMVEERVEMGEKVKAHADETLYVLSQFLSIGWAAKEENPRIPFPDAQLEELKELEHELSLIHDGERWARNDLKVIRHRWGLKQRGITTEGKSDDGKI